MLYSVCICMWVLVARKGWYCTVSTTAADGAHWFPSKSSGVTGTHPSITTVALQLFVVFWYLLSVNEAFWYVGKSLLTSVFALGKVVKKCVGFVWTFTGPLTATAPKYALVHSLRSQNVTCFFFFRVWIIGVWNMGTTHNALVKSFSQCCLEEAGNASGLPSARFTMCLHFLNWLWSVLRKVFGVFGQTCLYCSGHYVHVFFVVWSHTSTSLCYISPFSGCWMLGN